MQRRVLTSGVLLGALGALCLGLPGRLTAQTVKEAETIQVVKLLEEPFETKDFKEANAFNLSLLAEKFAARGRELPPFHIHYEAFKKGTKTRSILDGELPFPAPALPRRMSTLAFLRIMLAQLDDIETTYLLRNGVVEILPAKLATPKHLLQSRVTGAYAQEALADVLKTLSYQTGVSVVLDARAAELAKAPITAIFRNDVTLEAALRMVTEMAELKLVVLADGLFVTTPAHAEVLNREKCEPNSPKLARPVP